MGERVKQTKKNNLVSEGARYHGMEEILSPYAWELDIFSFKKVTTYLRACVS